MSDNQNNDGGKQKNKGGGNQAKNGVTINHNVGLDATSDQEVVMQGIKTSAIGIATTVMGGVLVGAFFLLKRSKWVNSAVKWITKDKVDLHAEAPARGGNSGGGGGSIFGVDRGMLSQQAQSDPDKVIGHLEGLLNQARGVAGKRNSNNNANLPAVQEDDDSSSDDSDNS